MARIKSYQKDTSISADDKVIGSDSTGVTRNYLISDLANFIHGEGGTYVHTQNSASTTWTINHNLGRFPSVSIKFPAAIMFIQMYKHLLGLFIIATIK